MYKWPTKLRPIVDKALEDILIQEEKKEEELKARQARFEENVNAVVKEIQSYNDCGEAKKIASYLQQVVAMQKVLQELEHELKLINEQEEIFGWNPTVKPEIAKGMVDCEPFEAFFRAVYDAQNNLHNWYDGAMVDLDPEQVEGEVDTMFRAAFKFCKMYNENKELLLLANSMKQTVADFKPHVPLIMTLCNKGIRDRHWDQMAKVQAQWLYLEPIFASDDIKKQIENPKVLVFTRKEGLLNDLSMAFEDLEIINKGLNAYLEQKRLNFSRFFFLSNNELLEILSETKDPTRVQPHLKKCFEAITKLKFDEQQIIHGMISSESELVPLPRTLDPALARGAVEKWLVETKTLMRESLIDQTLRAHAPYITAQQVGARVARLSGHCHWADVLDVGGGDGSGVGRHPRRAHLPGKVHQSTGRAD